MTTTEEYLGEEMAQVLLFDQIKTEPEEYMEYFEETEELTSSITVKDEPLENNNNEVTRDNNTKRRGRPIRKVDKRKKAYRDSVNFKIQTIRQCKLLTARKSGKDVPRKKYKKFKGGSNRVSKNGKKIGRPRGAKNKTQEQLAASKPKIKKEILEYSDYQCHKCFKYFSTNRNVRRHVQRVHDKNKTQIRCEFCNKVMKNEDHHNLHVKYNHTFNFRQIKPTCLECNKIFERKSSLITHVYKVHLYHTEPFTCDFCNLESKNKSSLRSHIKNNHIRSYGKNKHTCKYCNVKFSYFVQLKNHLRALNCIKVNPYKCEYCDRMYKNDNVLKNHIWQYHTGSQANKRFYCELCERNYLVKRDLAAHISFIHLKQRREKFICPFCSTEFQLKAVLRTHIRFSHNKSGLNKCNLCCRSYVRPHHLTRHLRDFHNKIVRPNTCGLCEIVLPNALALKMHKCQ